MAFTNQHRVVMAARQRDLVLERLENVDASYRQGQAQISETALRIQELKRQLAKLPERTTTQVRTADNPELLRALKSSLLDLELKKTQLLTKFEPSHRLVQEVEQQILQAKAAITGEGLSPVRDETTDLSANHEWAKAELQKAQVEMKGLEAREATTSTHLAEYRTLAGQLGEDAITQDDLTSSEKAAEDNYLLYVKKREEARIASALDQTRILNVVITEPPSVPALPSRSPWVFAMVGCLLACVLTAGLAVTLDYADQSLRTPSEVSSELKIPLLAAVPYHPNRKNGLNGKNGHNGLNGKNGKNGKNGNNGSHGDNGFQAHGISGTRMEARIGESDATGFSDKH